MPYDFDHSGLVNAYYAKPNPMLKINSVTERVYRGLCRRDPKTFSNIRNLYLAREEEILNTLNKYEEKFNEKEFLRLTQYIQSFYDIIKSDNDFKLKILSKCRG